MLMPRAPDLVLRTGMPRVKKRQRVSPPSERPVVVFVLVAVFFSLNIIESRLRPSPTQTFGLLRYVS